MRATRIALSTAGLLLAAPLSMAAEVSTPFQVSANVVRNCAIAATDLAFGAYAGVAGSPMVLGTSTITVTCNVGDTYTIRLSNGANALGGGPSAQRRMASVAAPVAYLNYALFRNAARTQTWRDTGNQWIGGTGTGAAQSYTVFGELPGSQVVPMGPYVDTVTATVRN